MCTGSYGDLYGELRKVLAKDSNVACVAEAMACCACLAKGLRKEYAAVARGLTRCVVGHVRRTRVRLCLCLCPTCAR